MRRGTAAACGPHVATLGKCTLWTPGDRIPVDPPPAIGYGGRVAIVDAIVDDGVCSLGSSDGAREIENLRYYLLFFYFIKRGIPSPV